MKFLFVCTHQIQNLIPLFEELEKKKEIDFKFEPFEEYEMRFEANNNILKGFINNKLLIEVEDKTNQFEKGMIGCIVENGTIISDEISIN